MKEEKEKLFKILDEPNYLISMQDSVFAVTNNLKLTVQYKNSEQEIDITVLQYIKLVQEANPYSFMKSFTKENKEEFISKVKEILND